MYPIDPPAPLWRYFRRSVVKILILGFQKAVINLIQFVIEHLLRKLFAVRGCIRTKQDAVLIFVKKLPGSTRLPPQFADPCCSVHGHIGKSIEVVGYVLQVFGKITDMQGDKLRFWMFGKNAVSGFQQFRVAWKVTAVEGPV